MKKFFLAVGAACTLALAPVGTPVRADQAPAPACVQFSASGYLYDSTFETEEYVNGLLVIHLRMLPTYDDGRNWVPGFNLYSADCAGEYVKATVPGFAVPPGDINYSIRFTTATHYQFWGDDSGQQIVQNPNAGYAPWVTDLPTTMSNGKPYTQVAFSGYVAGENTSVVSASAPVTGVNPNQRDPVIIVPGILGSVLQDQDVTLWPNLGNMVLDPSSSFMDPLAMGPDGTPVDKNVFPQSVLSSIGYKFGTFHYTDSLIQLLVANGYIAGSDVFTFPYDWRLNPKDVSGLLGAEVSSVLAQTGAQKVDIVAHSLGGLVLKQYLNDIHTASASVEQHIGKVVFVGVPNLGSAEAAKTLIFGGNFGVPLLSAAEIQKLSLNMPSIYSLLPSVDYYKSIAGFYDDLANPLVKQILNHDQAKSLLLSLGKNASLLSAADQLHSTSLDEFDFSSRPYQAYNVVGCGVFTLKTINRMYSGTGNLVSRVFSGPKYRLYADSGDGTVLTQSASHLAVPAGNTYYVNGAEHAGLLSNTGVESQILEVLAGKPIQTASGVTQDSSTCSLQGKLVSYNSDMDITVTDVTTGKPVDPATFPSEDIDTGKNVFIPTGNGQVYIVTLTPKPAQAQTEAQSGSVPPAAEDVSVSQIVNQTVTVDDYDKVPASSKDPIAVGIGDGQPTVTEENPDGTTSTVAPTTSFDQGSLATATALTTTIRAYLGQQLPAAGVLQLDASDPRVQFSVSDPTSFASYGYSFDGGTTFTVATDPQATVAVPQGTGSVTFYSLSKEDIAEVPQSVAITWVNVSQPPQTIVEQGPPATVIVQPQQPQQPPEPTPAEDPGASNLLTVPDASGSAPDAGTSADLGTDPPADAGSQDSDGSAVEQDKTIPPININITVHQPDAGAVLGASHETSSESVDNNPAGGQGPARSEVFFKGTGGIFSRFFSGIWKLSVFIARLMFI